jgi:hypothetical protein
VVDRTLRPIVTLQDGDDVRHRRNLAMRANACLPKDGTEGMVAPIKLQSVLAADLPDAALWAGAALYVSDEDAIAWSDGATWFRGATQTGLDAVIADVAALEAYDTAFYETGTFTPTLDADGTNFDSVTYDALTGGLFTRVGNLVHFSLSLRTDAVTVGSASGNANIDGLPLANVDDTGSTNDARVAVAVADVNGWAGEQPSEARIGAGGSSIFLYYRTTPDGASTRTVIADVGTGSNANHIRIAGTYITSEYP